MASISFRVCSGTVLREDKHLRCKHLNRENTAKRNLWTIGTHAILAPDTAMFKPDWLAPCPNDIPFISGLNFFRMSERNRRQNKQNLWKRVLNKVSWYKCAIHWRCRSGTYWAALWHCRESSLLRCWRVTDKIDLQSCVSIYLYTFRGYSPTSTKRLWIRHADPADCLLSHQSQPAGRHWSMLKMLKYYKDQ